MKKLKFIYYFLKVFFTAFFMLFNRKKNAITVQPKTLEEAVNRLLRVIRFLPEDEKQRLLSYDCPRFSLYLFDEAPWTMPLKNVWNLWDSKSPLRCDLKSRFGVTYAEDAFSVIFACAHQVMNDIDPDPNSIADQINNIRQAVELPAANNFLH